MSFKKGAYDYKLPFEVNHKQEMVLVSSPMKRKQLNKYLGYLRESFEIEYREDKGDRTENGMTAFDSAIPNNYELLKEAKEKSSAKKTANNGKGISVGISNANDHYEYQVIRLYK